MSTREVLMFAAVCDRCGKQAEYGGEFVAWTDEPSAIEMATESWEFIQIDSGRLLCDDCWEWSEDENDQVEKPAPDTATATDTRPTEGNA